MSADDMNARLRAARLRGTAPAPEPAPEPTPGFDGGARTTAPVDEPAGMNELMRASRLARGMSGTRAEPPTAAEFESALDQYRRKP